MNITYWTTPWAFIKWIWWLVVYREGGGDGVIFWINFWEPPQIFLSVSAKRAINTSLNNYCRKNNFIAPRRTVKDGIWNTEIQIGECSNWQPDFITFNSLSCTQCTTGSQWSQNIRQTVIKRRRPGTTRTVIFIDIQSVTRFVRSDHRHYTSSIQATWHDNQV